MQETAIVNVSHIVHHNGSTEKDQQITYSELKLKKTDMNRVVTHR